MKNFGFIKIPASKNAYSTYGSIRMVKSAPNAEARLKRMGVAIISNAIVGHISVGDVGSRSVGPQSTTT